MPAAREGDSGRNEQKTRASMETRDMTGPITRRKKANRDNEHAHCDALVTTKPFLKKKNGGGPRRENDREHIAGTE